MADFWGIHWHVIPDPRATLQDERIPSAILQTVFRHILFFFGFLNVIWAFVSSGFRIVSDTLVTFVTVCETVVAIVNNLSE